MQKYQILLIVWFLIAILFTKVSAQTNNSLIISEVMPNPTGSDSIYEWIEVKNISKSDINLKDWQLNGKTLPEQIIKSNELIILARDITSLKSKYKINNKVLKFSFSLLNSGANIELKSRGVINNFSYTESKEDLSFELLQGECNLIKQNGIGNSIGKENSLCEINKPINYDEKLSIVKVCPSVKNGKDYIQLKNSTLSTISLLGWTLNDLKTKEIFKDILIQPQEIKTLYPDKVLLNNDGDTVKLSHPNNGFTTELKYPKMKDNECYPIIIKPQIAVSISTKTSGNTPSIEVKKNISSSTNSGIKLDLKIPKFFRLLFRF